MKIQILHDSAWFCSSAPVTVTPSDDMAMPNPYVNLLSLTISLEYGSLQAARIIKSW